MTAKFTLVLTEADLTLLLTCIRCTINEHNNLLASGKRPSPDRLASVIAELDNLRYLFTDLLIPPLPPHLLNSDEPFPAGDTPPWPTDARPTPSAPPPSTSKQETTSPS